MKRLARLSLRVRLTLLFAVLTAAAWGIASVIAWQQTSKSWISCLIPSNFCSPAA